MTSKPHATTSVDRHAILITGATHSREMISTSMAVYQLLQLLKLGDMEGKENKRWKTMLEQNKYFFLPIFNVDGVALIEKNWPDTHKIVPDRKNMDSKYSAFECKGTSNEKVGVDYGVDLNRNFGIDFGQVDDIL